MKRILTFDVVGTLIDFEGGIAEHIGAIAHGAQVEHSTEAILAAFGVAESQLQQSSPDLSFTEMLHPIYLLMSETLGLPPHADDGKGFRDSISDWPAFSDSVAALAELRGHFRLVALTNADNWALGQMAATLGNPFDDTVTTEDVGVNKPDPRMFAYCLGRQSTLGYELNEYIHVAQSQYHDIGVAVSLGYTTCWVERRSGSDSSGATPAVDNPIIPDYHVTSLSEFAKAIL